MTTHLDLDGLCDLLAGEGEPAQLGHVAACPTCSQQLADLEQAQEPVRALLAALPPPEVPADLAARLDAALLRARDEELAHVSRARTGDGRSTPAGRHGRSVHHRSRVAHRTRRPSWLLGGAAAVVVVAAVAGVGVGLSRLGGGGVSSDTAASGSVAARGASPTVPASSTGTDYGAGRPALAAALPALLHGPAPAPSLAVNASGSQRDPDSLDAALARLHSPDGLADCLAGLTDPASSEGPLALDYARYAGAPALVVVLPAAVPERLDVFVVGADCRAGAEDTLLFTELPRTS